MVLVFIFFCFVNCFIVFCYGIDELSCNIFLNLKKIYFKNDYFIFIVIKYVVKIYWIINVSKEFKEYIISI